MQGRVLWFDNAKGYGFIRTEDDKEMFFHHSHIERDGYKFAYSGTPVMIELDEETQKINKVVMLQRIAPTGKPIILVAYMKMRGDSDLTQFNFDIARKAESGIKYIIASEDVIMCTDKLLSMEEQLAIKGIIFKYEPKSNTPIETSMEYDIIFI